eukprot:TRINITY_DN920_c1_g2_i4.p1 TRINITY_DN920_c1_g2~~TRINITY_DN920_c1_g2_i4.p1  ORF type:complete len:689 (-),score=235.99 TRINITY_DN920_c1_g2_i4:215-2281(-)
MVRQVAAAGLAVLCASSASASDSIAVSHVDADLAANPIRKVVTMIQKIAKKVDEEAEAEEELYKKFECYCTKTQDSLEEAITKATSTGPITPEDIAAKVAEAKAKQEEVEKLKNDKIEDESSLQAAKVNRGKEHDKHMKSIDDDKETENAAESALKALGSPSFLQQASVPGVSSFLPALMKAFDHSKKVSPLQKDKVSGFLQGKGQGVDTVDVKIYIEDVEHEAEEGITEETAEDQHEEVDYSAVKKSKKDEIAALLNMMEKKMSQIGELKVEAINMKHDMEDGAVSLAENKKMLIEVKKNCAQKASDRDARRKTRSEEQLALAETIKMLNSDDALDLFKKSLPSPSLIQVVEGREQARDKAMELISGIKSEEHKPALNFLAMALAGKKVDFKQVFKQIDEMLALMKKEQVDDENKKAYCHKEFDEAGDSQKTFTTKISELSTLMTSNKEAAANLAEEVKSLQAGIASLDASIATAGENRKAEHAEYLDVMNSDTAAIKLLEMAKNRLNKFYNPSQYVNTATTTGHPFDPYSFAQVNSHNFRNAEAPATPGSDYKKKSEESNGIIAMLTTLAHDLEKEMAVAKTEESDAQEEYSETVADAQRKREADMKLAASKAKAKADYESDMIENKENKGAKEASLLATKKYVSDLHGECDWLLQNFDLRKSARAEEQENLTRAKATLAGADLSN